MAKKKRFRSKLEMQKFRKTKEGKAAYRKFDLFLMGKGTTKKKKKKK